MIDPISGNGRGGIRLAKKRTSYFRIFCCYCHLYFCVVTLTLCHGPHRSWGLIPSWSNRSVGVVYLLALVALAVTEWLITVFGQYRFDGRDANFNPNYRTSFDFGGDNCG